MRTARARNQWSVGQILEYSSRPMARSSRQSRRIPATLCRTSTIGCLTGSRRGPLTAIIDLEGAHFRPWKADIRLLVKGPLKLQHYEWRGPRLPPTPGTHSFIVEAPGQT